MTRSELEAKAAKMTDDVLESLHARYTARWFENTITDEEFARYAVVRAELASRMR